MEITNKSGCTACMLCAVICPQNCIDIKKDTIDAEYPNINESQCIKCNKCIKLCPNNKKIILNTVKEVYVAWNKNSEYRKNSASGGVASAIYQYAADNGIKFCGVRHEKNKTEFAIGETKDDLNLFSNSKYVYVNPSLVFYRIKKLLISGESIYYIGLPCQIDALLSYLKDVNTEKLVTIDLICHGIAPTTYFDKHLDYINVKYFKNKGILRTYFRDPKYGTANYIFSCYSTYKSKYSRAIKSNDTYNLGYHKALIFRTNCYECKYAKAGRVGDLTLGDYRGIGKLSPYNMDKKNISCVMVNTLKGKDLFSKLQSKNLIFCEKRLLEEPSTTEKQLIHPSCKHIQREMFEEYYKNDGNFERAVYFSLKNEINKYSVYRKVGINALKIFLRNIGIID